MSDVRDIKIENLGSVASDKIVPWFIATSIDFGDTGYSTTSTTYNKIASDEIGASFFLDVDTAFPEMYVRLILRGRIADASAEIYARLLSPAGTGLCEVHTNSTSYTIMDSGWVAVPSSLSGVGVWAIQMRTTDASYAAICSGCSVLIGFKMDN